MCAERLPSAWVFIVRIRRLISCALAIRSTSTSDRSALHVVAIPAHGRQPDRIDRGTGRVSLTIGWWRRGPTRWVITCERGASSFVPTTSGYSTSCRRASTTGRSMQTSRSGCSVGRRWSLVWTSIYAIDSATPLPLSRERQERFRPSEMLVETPRPCGHSTPPAIRHSRNSPQTRTIYWRCMGSGPRRSASCTKKPTDPREPARSSPPSPASFTSIRHSDELGEEAEP
jgi:hypothetical protein